MADSRAGTGKEQDEFRISSSVAKIKFELCLQVSYTACICSGVKSIDIMSIGFIDFIPFSLSKKRLKEPLDILFAQTL